MRAQLMQAGRHFVGLDAVAVALLTVFLELTLGLGDIGAKAHHFTLDQHIETVAVGQRLMGDHLQVALAGFSTVPTGRPVKVGVSKAPMSILRSLTK